MTNHTGRTESGELSVDALLDRGYQVKALFSPEHGIFGVEQDGVKTGDGEYGKIPSFSLYGENRRPSGEQLDGLEMILFDMQEIGSRFYTYLYTLAYVMEEAAKKGIAVVVTDRPAPLGRKIEGNPIASEFDSFVGAYGLPCRTGMTIGEYALYLKEHYIPGCELEVVETERETALGWKDYRWINPSPNIPTMNSALIYGGTCLVEGTVLSEGRGTTRPFEQIGAPWIDGRILAGELNSIGLEGVCFTSSRFKPEFSKHKGEVCGGIQVHCTDGNVLSPLKTGVAILGTIASLYPEQTLVRERSTGEKHSFMDKLTGTGDFALQLEKRTGWKNLYGLISGGEETFEKKRFSSLLY